MSAFPLSMDSQPTLTRPAGPLRLAAGALFAGTGTVPEDAARFPRSADPGGLRAALRAVFGGASPSG
jgi:hypothetical protein